MIEQSIAPSTTVQGGTEIIFTVYGSSGDQPQTIRVQFIVPDEVSGEDTIRVEFILDDVVVDTKIFSGDDAVVSYDFEGKPGTAVTVYARINGIATDSQVISF